MHKINQNEDGILIESVETPDYVNWLVGWLKEHFQFFNTSLPKHCHIWDNWGIVRFEMKWTNKAEGLAKIKAYFINELMINGQFKFNDQYPHVEQQSSIEMIYHLMLKAEIESNKELAADWADDFKKLLALAECQVEAHDGGLYIKTTLNEENCKRALDFSLAFSMGFHHLEPPYKPWEDIYAGRK